MMFDTQHVWHPIIGNKEFLYIFFPKKISEIFLIMDEKDIDWSNTGIRCI